jgi:hypothetical protein
MTLQRTIQLVLLMGFASMSVACQSTRPTKVDVIKNASGASKVRMVTGGGDIIVFNLVEHCCAGDLMDCEVKTTTFCPSGRPISVFKSIV